ncbi:N-acetylmuramoyl-L-alanine amidase [Synechococcus sp. ROS8604]|nr:N-acetylmuramoyl-L-alanine amidase [Synechococcus sp. ROS8604]
MAERPCLSELNGWDAICMAARMYLHWTATGYDWIRPGL